ncbi:hypothetical protein, partial [Okeania hirsuta]|uniref:hypothetical protein n=1 Tax=Okeania hirsuta TaxID=1458930 RepID=UPI000FB51B0D
LLTPTSKDFIPMLPDLILPLLEKKRIDAIGKIFFLLVDWICGGDPFLQTRSEDRHPTLRKVPKIDRFFSPLKERLSNLIIR